MIKKKLTALIAVVLMLVMVFPATAFAYSPESEETTAESAETTVSTEDTTEMDSGNTEDSPEDLESFLSDPDMLGMLMAGMDPEILEVLKEHPKLIAMLLPTLHVTVTEGSVTISIDKQEAEDPAQTGTVTTGGSNLNVRTGAGISNEIITQLTNGTSVNVLSEKDGWYQIEIPARYGYVCGDYLRVNDIPSTQTDEGYSFDIDGSMILSFLELFVAEPETPSSSHGLTPKGNLTLVDDYGERNGEGQQFITLVTKAGNYFYLIIDRDEKGEETVHFLNLVDERDLFALMEEDEAADYQAQLAAEQAAREAAERAAAEAASQTGENETGTTEPAQEGEKKTTNFLPVVIIILLMAAVGGGWFFMQTKKKKQAANEPDPDADYTDDYEDYGAGEEDDDYDVSDDEDPYETEPADDEPGEEAEEDQ